MIQDLNKDFALLPITESGVGFHLFSHHFPNLLALLFGHFAHAFTNPFAEFLFLIFGREWSPVLTARYSNFRLLPAGFSWRGLELALMKLESQFLALDR
ncbi:MAG: hypothetical protein AAF236_10505, partial [Verrucomicrobiota bacterium]